MRRTVVQIQAKPPALFPGQEGDHGRAPRHRWDRSRRRRASPRRGFVVVQTSEPSEALRSADGAGKDITGVVEHDQRIG